jgi:hypothetical protein
MDPSSTELPVSPTPAEDAIHSSSADALIAAAGDAGLSEDMALALLKRRDLPAEALEHLARNAAVMKSRKVKLALVEHPRTPRHISLPTIRHLFTFDLMQVALTPVVPPDVKAAADETLINRLETIPSGQRLALARRASGRVAEALLADGEARVMEAALENARLTEAGVVKALMRAAATAGLVQAVCHHAKWSLRREVRIALLRNQHTPMARAVEFARGLPAPMVREILHGSHLAPSIKEFLVKSLG